MRRWRHNFCVNPCCKDNTAQLTKREQIMEKRPWRHFTNSWTIAHFVWRNMNQWLWTKDTKEPQTPINSPSASPKFTSLVIFALRNGPVRSQVLSWYLRFENACVLQMHATGRKDATFVCGHGLCYICALQTNRFAFSYSTSWIRVKVTFAQTLVTLFSWLVSFYFSCSFQWICYGFPKLS